MKSTTLFHTRLLILAALLLGAMAADEGAKGQKFDVVANYEDMAVRDHRPVEKAGGGWKAHRVRRNRNVAEIWY